jgi:putative ubiquitin-RnfH superfamily antitoxin RatB of RatAB toxin-antitoxin module
MMPSGIVVEVVQATRERQVVRPIRMPEGATVADALAAAGLDDGPVGAPASVGVWGRIVPLDTVLRDGDRVEIHRALVADPKDARRRRVARKAREA